MKDKNIRNEKRIRKIKEIIGTEDISSEKMQAQLGLSEKQMTELEIGLPVPDEVLEKVCETYKVKMTDLV